MTLAELKALCEKAAKEVYARCMFCGYVPEIDTKYKHYKNCVVARLEAQTLVARTWLPALIEVAEAAQEYLRAPSQLRVEYAKVISSKAQTKAVLVATLARLDEATGA